MSSAGSVEGHERPRLFVALRLPGDVVERLVAWQARLPDVDARLVPPENLHMTVAFLGARPGAQVEPIVRELHEAAAAAKPMEFDVRDYRETRSVGMVRFADRSLNADRFVQDVSARLARLGVYEPEGRRWLPHVTVLRFRAPPRLRPKGPVPDLDSFSPSDAALYHSLLRPSGAQYSVIEAAALGG